MSYNLRREETVDADQLRGMLEESPAKAAQAILAAAGQGVVQAQLLLGQILLDGRGIERDLVLARQWFAIAAQGGSAMAHNMLGRCLEHGWGGEQDLAQAVAHYRTAAQAGLDWGLYNYANMLGTGRGVAQDQAGAFAAYRRAAQDGHAKSMNLLGRYLELGIACDADFTRARRWYRRSAQAGDFRGQFSHAAVLAEQGEVGEALGWLRRALEAGNANFLRSSIPELERARDARVRGMAERYRERLGAM
ncbi:MAG TPA: tetratricopeptide repeat protein [Pseudomonas sp.]|uniref:tetratricopeptide repeat protein n=1 Tax=Pseudomonas sp. TaxID=306 RepID=UPI002B4A347A|nr:tetratricopeptide repeat protein [Pseudomonas sp.]HKS13712.1 tetratricopeptide repeat protein [Pseudomonas sp.]